MTVPKNPSIYHIVHLSRLESILSKGSLLCDREIRKLPITGVVIGIDSVKERRAISQLNSYSDLHVGDCVPFYFCPRSIMLYLIFRANHPNLDFVGGQTQIIHIRFELYPCVDWANKNNLRWAFSTSNAGSAYFDDFNDLNYLSSIDWNAVNAQNWSNYNVKEGKQAEFLIEKHITISNAVEFGVFDKDIYQKTVNLLQKYNQKSAVNIRPNWYY